MAFFGGKKATQQQQPSQGPQPFSGSLYKGGEQDRNFLGELEGFRTSLGSEMKERVKIMEDAIREARTKLAKLISEKQQLEIVGSQLKQYYDNLKAMLSRQVDNVRGLQSEYERMLTALGLNEEQIQQLFTKLGITKTKGGGK